ncbi:hypothetical protein ACEWY4_005876 [Coilia grayii]|uniref:SCAN box domain-containing protein n=1 Tax=Coilia grayii TaxID=363190 RepID=A0ABD1KK67_9TELE
MERRSGSGGQQQLRGDGAMPAAAPDTTPAAAPPVATPIAPPAAAAASAAPPSLAVRYPAPPAAPSIAPYPAPPAALYPAPPAPPPPALYPAPSAVPWMPVRLPAAPPAAPLSLVPDPAAPAPATWTRAAVPRFEEGDDVEQYLTTFERLATAYRRYLAKYEISAESYRARFRDPNIQPGETPREFYNRLKDLYQKWIRPAERTVEEIGEILILEQFLRSLSPEVRVWVKEHNPHTGLKAAELVDSFLAARRGPKDFRFQGISRAPQKGSTHTLVQPHLVKQPEVLTGQRLRVCCVNGDEHEYPIAVICLKIHEQTYKLEACVVKGLRHPVVLDQDVLILPDLVQATLPVQASVGGNEDRPLSRLPRSSACQAKRTISSKPTRPSLLLDDPSVHGTVAIVLVLFALGPTLASIPHLSLGPEELQPWVLKLAVMPVVRSMPGVLYRVYCIS